MGSELTAFGVRQRGGDGDLNAELVRCPGLALADALHFRRVQRVDLGAALVRLLVEHPSRQHQDAPKDKLTEQVGTAFDLAGNVADDATEIGSELLQRPGWRRIFGRSNGRKFRHG
jgi:hypothetical protein